MSQPVDKRLADIDAEVVRQIDRAMRRAIEETFPEMLPALAAKYPVQFGPDSLERIRFEFPEFFRDDHSKG
jgi:hypothetical protein